MKKLIGLFLVLGLTSLASAKASLPDLLKEAAADHWSVVAGKLKAQPLSVKQTDAQGDTLLLLATAAEQEKIVGEILSLHPDLKHRNKQGQTALNLALLTGHEAIVLRLLQAGAVADEADFLKAADKNMKGATQWMAKDKRLWPSQDAEGNTALHLAARSGSLESLRVLLKAGLDKKVKNKKNQTARDLALENNNPQAALILK